MTKKELEKIKLGELNLSYGAKEFIKEEIENTLEIKVLDKLISDNFNIDEEDNLFRISLSKNEVYFTFHIDKKTNECCDYSATIPVQAFQRVDFENDSYEYGEIEHE